MLDTQANVIDCTQDWGHLFIKLVLLIKVFPVLFIYQLMLGVRDQDEVITHTCMVSARNVHVHAHVNNCMLIIIFKYTQIFLSCTNITDLLLDHFLSLFLSTLQYFLQTFLVWCDGSQSLLG